MMEEPSDQKKRLDILYILGLAPILAWPICLISSVMISSDRDVSRIYLWFNIGLAFFYPLVPIVCVVASIIAQRTSHPRLAYIAALAPLIFYCSALVASYFIYYLT